MLACQLLYNMSPGRSWLPPREHASPRRGWSNFSQTGPGTQMSPALRQAGPDTRLGLALRQAGPDTQLRLALRQKGPDTNRVLHSYRTGCNTRMSPALRQYGSPYPVESSSQTRRVPASISTLSLGHSDMLCGLDAQVDLAATLKHREDLMFFRPGTIKPSRSNLR